MAEYPSYYPQDVQYERPVSSSSSSTIQWLGYLVLVGMTVFLVLILIDYSGLGTVPGIHSWFHSSTPTPTPSSSTDPTTSAPTFSMPPLPYSGPTPNYATLFTQPAAQEVAAVKDVSTKGSLADFLFQSNIQDTSFMVGRWTSIPPTVKDPKMRKLLKENEKKWRFNQDLTIIERHHAQQVGVYDESSIQLNEMKGGGGYSAYGVLTAIDSNTMVYSYRLLNRPQKAIFTVLYREGL